jgi:hypothetical protein
MYPQRRRQQGGGHDENEMDDGHVVIGPEQALGDRIDDVATSENCARRLADRRDCQSASHGEGATADGRTHIVGNIVGADAERHVGGNDRRHDHKMAQRILGDRQARQRDSTN